MTYAVEVKVKLKPGVLDAEGKNIQKSLELLGIATRSVSSVKTYWLNLDRETEDEAVQAAKEACKRLLANPVVHDYSIRVLPESERAIAG